MPPLLFEGRLVDQVAHQRQAPAMTSGLSRSSSAAARWSARRDERVGQLLRLTLYLRFPPSSWCRTHVLLRRARRHRCRPLSASQVLQLISLYQVPRHHRRHAVSRWMPRFSGSRHRVDPSGQDRHGGPASRQCIRPDRRPRRPAPGPGVRGAAWLGRPTCGYQIVLDQAGAVNRSRGRDRPLTDGRAGTA